jgi:hypothetical protein
VKPPCDITHLDFVTPFLQSTTIFVLTSNFVKATQRHFIVSVKLALHDKASMSDHQSTSARPTAHQDQPFRFLELSQELRDYIYQYLIIQGKPTRLNRKIFQYNMLVDLWLYAPLLRVNRQVRNEYCDKICATRHATSSDHEVKLNIPEHPTARNATAKGCFQHSLVPMGLRCPLFIKHIRSLAVEITSFLEHDLAASQLQTTSYLIRILEGAEQLRSVRIVLLVPEGGIFSFSWVLRELEGFRAIQGFSMAVIDVPILRNDTKETVTLYAEPCVSSSGWKHVGSCSRPLFGWQRLVHSDGFDQECFQCWIAKRDAGEIRLPIADSYGKMINRRIRW